MTNLREATKAKPRHQPWTVPGEVFQSLAAMARPRAALPHLHATVPTQIAGMDDPGVLYTVRHHPLGDLVGLYSVTAQWRPWPAYRLGEHGIEVPYDALAGSVVIAASDGSFWLPPYAAWWLVERP